MAEDSPHTHDEESYDGLPSFPKTELLERLLAKFIDFLFAGALIAFPSFIGPLAAITYMLISDGLKGGQSIGKRIIGLRVISTRGAAAPCDFKQSMIRNGMFGALIALYFILGPVPYVGKLIVFLAWAGAIGAEIMLMYSDESGARFGDKIADTLVVGARAEKG